MRLRARRLEVRGCWVDVEDRSRVGISFMMGLQETHKIGRGSVLGDSECTWKLVGVIIGGATAVGVRRMCTGCGSLYND
jgi:hypothetical protein